MKFQSINPASKTIIKDYETYDWDRIQSIVQHADESYKTWRYTDFNHRKQLFNNLANILREGKDEYAKLMTLEMGKPIKQALAEVEKCAWTCEVYSENFEDWLQKETIDADGIVHQVVYQPLGVILAVMPWNFPFWQVFRFAIPTIIAGNAAVLKHSNNVPGCALAIHDAFLKAGFPVNIFNTLLADHQSVEQLLSLDLIQGVSLTGSSIAGSKIAEIAGKHIKKVVLELGGSDPFIIFDDVDIDFVIKNAIIGRTQNNGQSCIAAKRFIVHQSIANEFGKRFAKALDKLTIGDPLDPNIDIGPMANQAEFETVNNQLKDAMEKKGEILTTNTTTPQGGFFFRPCLVSQTNQDMKIVKEEVFGPLAPIITFENEQEAITLANQTEFGLGGSVWTSDLERGKRIAMALNCGATFVNSIVKSDPRIPFGGIKKSGIGRELSKFGLKEFMNIKSVNIYSKK